MQHVTALVVIVLVLLLPLLLLLLLLLLLYAMLLSSNTKCPLNVSDHTWLLLCLCVCECVFGTQLIGKTLTLLYQVSRYKCVSVCVYRVHRRVYCGQVKIK